MLKGRTTQSTKGINILMRNLLIQRKKLLQKKKVFTECDLACIAEITMRKHVNTKHECVHSDIGDKQIKFEKVQ